MFLPTYAHLLDNEQGIPFASRLKRTFHVRRIRRISRRTLGEPAESPFMKLYNSGCVQSMITYTGFNFQAFNDLLQLLSTNPLARIRMPTADIVASFQQATAEKYPLLPDIWGTCDGVKLNFQLTGDVRIQRMYYNGWTHGHYVSNILFLQWMERFEFVDLTLREPCMTAAFRIIALYMRS